MLRTFTEPSETFIVREIEALRGDGVPVTVLAGWRAAGRTPAGLPVEILSDRPSLPPPPSSLREIARLAPSPRRVARGLRLASYAARAARVVPGDTVRLHAHFGNDAATLARYLAGLVGLPYRVTTHAYDLYQDPFLLGPNLRAAERVYTVSEANLAWLSARAASEGWRLDRFSVLRCGIVLASFPYRDPAPPSRPARLFCPARLVPKKGHALLLDATERLVAEGTDVRLALAGDGPLGDDLRSRAERGALAGRVEFLGTIPEAEVRERMRASDLVVLASRVAEDGDRDGLPVVLVEALALGVPVVTTRVAGIPELVTDESGHLVPPDRADLLALALGDALRESAEGRIARAREGRAAVERAFDVGRQVAELRPR